MTLYAKAFTASEDKLTVYADGDVSAVEINESITGISTAVWTQYGRAFDMGASDTLLTVRLGFTSGAGATDVGIGGILISPNNPHGLADAAFAATSPVLPFITSRFCRHFPGSTGKDVRIAVYDLPGDSPLPTRTFIKAP
jgi:hypothetical protein